MRDLGLSAIDLVVGRKYRVLLEDCCIIGEFQAVFLSRTPDSPGYEPDSYSGAVLVFDNGVSLTTYGGCKFYEAQP